MKRFFIGSITFVLVLFNAIWIILAVTPIGLLRFLPSRRIKIGVLKFNERLGEYYLNGNKFIQDLMHKPKYRVEGMEHCKMDVWQFTTINHLSWADIFLFLYFTNFKATCPRIFMKAELWWLPITWAANIGLGMPFVKRRKKEDIIKNPQLALHDKNATIKACEIYKLFPTNVCGFIEGTRIDKEKYDNSKSKFKNLMPPKIGGMGYTLEVMPYIDTLTDITLIYKSSKRTFWDFLCGDMNEATVLINSFDIPNHLRGKDYSFDNEGREEFRNFLEEIWQKKDEVIEREKKKFGIEKVF